MATTTTKNNKKKNLPKIKLTERGERLLEISKTHQLPKGAEKYQSYFENMIWNFNERDSVANTKKIEQRGTKKEVYV